MPDELINGMPKDAVLANRKKSHNDMQEVYQRFNLIPESEEAAVALHYARALEQLQSDYHRTLASVKPTWDADKILNVTNAGVELFQVCNKNTIKLLKNTGQLGEGEPDAR